MTDSPIAVRADQEQDVLERIADALTVNEVTKLCRVSRGSVQGWLKAGRLKSVKAGARVLIPRDSLRRFLAEQ